MVTLFTVCIILLAGADVLPAATYYLDAQNGLDGNSGTRADPCRTLAKGVSLAESNRTSIEPTVIYLAPGNYGSLSWELPGHFTSEVTWISSDTANPARITGLSLESASGNYRARQTFDGIDFHSPSGASGLAVILIDETDYVTIRNSEIHNEDLYLTNVGIKIQGCRNGTFDNNHVHDVVHAIRFTGTDHAFTNNRIDRIPGTVIGCLCGGFDGMPQSARDILIAHNVVQHPTTHYPSEPGYANYDEPHELHQSVLSIRGDRFTIDNNVFFNITNMPYIQFYDGDCGVDDYLIGDITVTNNIFYSFDGTSIFHSPGNGDLDGPAIVENNTIIGSSFGITLEDDYDGAGSVMRNNLVYGSFSGILHRSYQDYDAPGVAWKVEHNIVSSRSWQLGKGTRVDPSNIFVDEAISAGTLPANFWDALAFINPDYTRPCTEFCGPKGDGDCDWTPKAGNIICTGGSDGGYVGAVSCDGTVQKIMDILYNLPEFYNAGTAETIYAIDGSKVKSVNLNLTGIRLIYDGIRVRKVCNIR